MYAQIPTQKHMQACLHANNPTHTYACKKRIMKKKSISIIWDLETKNKVHCEQPRKNLS